VIGDHHPLVLDGYRFYTTSNKGFAPLLEYTDKTGQTHSGSIHMPGYPVYEDTQGNEWTTPDGTVSVSLWLELSEPIYKEDAQWEFVIPADTPLIVTLNDKRTTLMPGDAMVLGDGVLRYLELRSWMGYGISYNQTIPWILASALIAVCGMGWHIARKFYATPWDRNPDNPAPLKNPTSC
jgi:cytochrome c biogenesis protein